MVAFDIPYWLVIGVVAGAVATIARRASTQRSWRPASRAHRVRKGDPA